MLGAERAQARSVTSNRLGTTASLGSMALISRGLSDYDEAKKTPRQDIAIANTAEKPRTSENSDTSAKDRNASRAGAQYNLIEGSARRQIVDLGEPQPAGVFL